MRAHAIVVPFAFTIFPLPCGVLGFRYCLAIPDGSRHVVPSESSACRMSGNPELSAHVLLRNVEEPVMVFGFLRCHEHRRLDHLRNELASLWRKGTRMCWRYL
jgi:hypothetical protein